MKTLLNGKWNLKDFKENRNIPADVPGDITIDLFNAGVIDDPYFGLNHRKLSWIIENDYQYERNFEFDGNLGEEEKLYICFKGIDLFSEIYVNGKKVGKTENMFLEYKFDISKEVKKGNNTLAVKMLSTKKAMDAIDCGNYFGVFNVPRLFIRKAQCHFGWDWAPDLSGYGIWNDVYLEKTSVYQIDNVYTITHNDGWVTILTELNYNIRATVDNMGVAISGTNTINKDDKLIIEFGEHGSSKKIVKEIPVTGKKNFINIKVDDVKLWWPHGFGDQPLYDYNVKLVRDNEVVSENSGRIAFRTVELEEVPKDENNVGYTIKINGVRIFCKGSNWVPIDCFTGTIKDEKYERLVKLAKDANINMLRVWGGGIYEKDIFYDLCDELGIMVSQDFMYACGDIPDERQDWLENSLAECEYQIKRLRNHPSIVYWCGGNEKTGAFGLQISKGDYFCDYILQGLVKKYDQTRPYARQSPCSLTDVGNDSTSGDSHAGCFEGALVDGVLNYRQLMTKKPVPFISECAVLGPNSIETNKKIYPEDKLFPTNEYWEDRLMDNPYSGIHMGFLERQNFYINTVYGEPKNIEEFTAKGMLVHGEFLRAEIEHARARKFNCSAIANWMYSDIWPCGTWSVVDYFGEPKGAFYFEQRAFSPILVTFVQDVNKKDNAVVINDTLNDLKGKVTYGIKTADGTIVAKKTVKVVIPADEKVIIESDFKAKEKEYLFIEASLNGKTYRNTYSEDFWRTMDLDGDYSYTVNKISENKVKLTFKGKKFAKMVFINLKDNNKYYYSENYFDLEAGETKEIIITSKEDIDERRIYISDFAKEIK